MYNAYLLQTDSIRDITREQLQVIQKTRTHPDPKVIADLRKRKLVKMQKVISYTIHKGPKFALEIAREETDLTADMLASYVLLATDVFSVLTIVAAHGRLPTSSHTTSGHSVQTKTPALYIL